MGFFDYFTADLRCPKCGAITPAESVDMQTKIRPEPRLEDLHVGDRCEMKPDPTVAGYLELARTRPGQPVRLVDSWSCIHCSYYPNWAEIAIRDEVIESIVPVDFDRSLLDRVHYVTDLAEDLIQELSGKSYVELQHRPRWPAAPTPESQALAQLARLSDEDAAALLAADREQLSIEERAFLDQIRAAVAAGRSLTEADIDHVHVHAIARHLP